MGPANRPLDMAWLARGLVEAELRQGQLVPAGEPCWTVPLEIRLYRQPATLAPAAEQLWRLVVAPQQGG
jgi:hypothetical protein